MNRKLMQVLLVEDNPADASTVRQSFSNFSEDSWNFYGVETLSDAIATYQHVKADRAQPPFDLVLLDLGLPDSRGLETVQQFLITSPEAPVVVLSGLDDETVALQAIAEGAQDYLVKGQINLQKLRKAIYFALKRQKILQQIQQSDNLKQQALNDAQKLNEQQSWFIGMVSHELRNPLGIVQSSSELIEMHLGNKLSAKIQRWIQNIQVASDQAFNLIDDLLTLCRLDSIQPNAQLTQLTFQNFFADLIEEVQQGSTLHHTIQLNIQTELKHTNTDIHLAKYIFSNLLCNAIKYTPEGGTILIDIESDAEWVTFTIQDSGMGIPEDEQQHLFEYFYRATNANHIQGTGLGLAIVKHCVGVLQGHIEVESHLDQGTTFRVYLPLVQPSIEDRLSIPVA